ncbi:flavodoxin [Caballeronia sp. GAWG2-1]|uniref:flavodoxin n=1 Tax=Caballeronia sp. GAWG2-1 TaxID=2921744 RepID=UPI002027E361|nr:flavodoxin [Caballeronia sp. GAWG2-1]
MLLPLVTCVASVLAAPEATPRSARKTLVTYFSRTGKTRVIAGQIQRARGAEIFEIQPATPYPEDYEQVVDQARREWDSGFEPALQARVIDIDAYSTVFLGFPIWGGTAPPIIRSFLSNHDWAGMTLIPFITHGGYGLGNSLTVLAAHAPQVRLLDAGLTLEANQERRTLDHVTDWLKHVPSTTEPKRNTP